MERYRDLVEDLEYIMNKFNGDEDLTTPELQRLHSERDYITEQLVKTSLFQFILRDMKYYLKCIYYTIADMVVNIKNKITNKKDNDDGEYPF